MSEVRAAAAPPTEALAGLVERVTFHSAETGFCVLRVKVRGQREPVTVVGHAALISAGEWVSASGVWVNDRTHGLQFKASFLKATAPTTLEGIEKYLGSGMIRGIGPVYAKKLVGAFGEAVFDLIEQHPLRLCEVPGIGPKRAARIVAGWAEQRVIREIMLFLHSHGVGTSRAVRIYKTYGVDAVKLISENPYRLARDIRGIGFRMADQIAAKLGIEKTAMVRVRAGISYALAEAMAEGLRALAADAPPWPAIDAEKALPWVEERTKRALAPSQREAARLALASKVLVITGGPGVGKTTLVNTVLTILRAKSVKIALAAPTGRAAKRLSESTGGLEAKTIHRLLEMDPKEGGFKRDEENPLDCDLLVVDEVSMVDAVLMRALLRALPDRAALLLVGDVDQLPSVGPGQVLADIIHSGAVPVVRLTEVFRQAAESRIVVNAHRINQSLMPEIARGEADPESDFHFV